MGTVGLNFGSPTSGTGFDVSSTVASIVSNLQNVETPWKTQLTTLESQDTAISSLGTLFSNLSNDISSLTDFDGIMAQKEGSSSDENILTLTAANSTAVAGTHTVTVTNLARTSSGYLAPLASASSTLSGSITLQVGSGASQKITLNSSDDTLSGLAAAINSSNVGISASVLTDANGSRLSLVSGTSGSAGDIIISANSLSAAVANTLSYTGTAAKGSVNAGGIFSPVGSAADTLSNSFSIQVSSGTAQPVSMAAVTAAEGGSTLSDVVTYINANQTSLGVSASVVTNSDGTSSLGLTSLTAGSAGNLTVASTISDPGTALSYTSSVAGSNANLTVDGISLTSASNTVANLIPGVTFQLLAPSAAESDGSLEQVQVVIANDNTGVESSFESLVSDYNALVSALNTQEGNDSSGNPEPLFGSPTLSLLQQQLLGSINLQSPSGALDSISSTNGTTVSGQMSISVGNGTVDTFVIGSGSDSAVAGTYYTDNTDTGGATNGNTLQGLGAAINAAGIGATANVVTSNGSSTLTLASQTAGSAGTLAITSAVTASSPSSVSYTGSGYTSSTAATGEIGPVTNSSDTLTGSFTLQVGGGTAEMFNMSSLSDQTLNGLTNAINNAGLGVKATLDPTGTFITLTSTAIGSAGALTASSSLLDPEARTTTALNYTSSSDINSLTSLGISVNNDGSIALDATSLDSVLNSDYSGAVGFFQNANGWGQTFSNMITNAGTSSSTGILALASSSNSNIESTLNAEITKESSLISAQQASLTAELNSANEIMQQLPTQLEGVNELYSAITGYDQNTNG